MKKRPRASYAVVIGVIALALVASVMLFNRNTRSANEIELPMIRTAVQNLGELHSIAHEYQHVSEHKTFKEPQGLAASIPLAKQVTRGLTENTSLIKYSARVEAGVDLSKASVEQTGLNEITVFVPSAKVYEPNVTAVVYDERKGMFWNDKNLHLKAQRAAGEKAKEAALSSGILSEAEKNASETVRNLLASAFDGTVNVVFEGSEPRSAIQ